MCIRDRDVGLDGLSDDAERLFFQAPYLDLVSANFAAALPAAQADPSNDNYRYFLNPDYSNAVSYTHLTLPTSDLV